MEFLANYGSSIISIIGFVVTIVVMKCQFKNAKTEKVSEQQRALYIDCYTSVEEVIKNNNLIFDDEYLEKIRSFQGRMKLIASGDVLNCYKKLLGFVCNIQNQYVEYSNSINPHENPNNYERVINEDTGEEYEIYHGNEHDDQIYTCKIDEYKENNKPQKDELKKYVDDLRDLMRKDFGTDKYSDK